MGLTCDWRVNFEIAVANDYMSFEKWEICAKKKVFLAVRIGNENRNEILNKTVIAALRLYLKCIFM